MRELLRLLDLHAGRCVKIVVCEHPFYLASTIEKGENRVSVEDGRPKVDDEFDDSVIMPISKIVADNWLDVSHFIRIRCKYNMAMTESHFYHMILAMVFQEFSKPMIPNRFMNDQFLKEALDRVVEEEPVIQNAIKISI